MKNLKKPILITVEAILPELFTITNQNIRIFAGHRSGVTQASNSTPFLFAEFFLVRWPLKWAMASSFTRFLNHTQRRTTFGRTPLEEWSARRRDLYLTTHNTHKRHPSMPPAGFEPTLSAGVRPQNYALDRAATETKLYFITYNIFPEYPLHMQVSTYLYPVWYSK